jgi:ADP-ribose pyrophosphatase YjhB (NUDIX family)
MPDYYFKFYKFCPVCGTKYSAENFNEDDTYFDCEKCHYRFYQNQIAVSSVIIPNRQNPYEILLATRSIEPAAGKIDTPGGFPKFEEELADAIRREIKEEIGMEIEIEEILDVKKNDYAFKGKTFKHATTYFLAKPIEQGSIEEAVLDKNELSDIQFYDLRELDKFEDKLGFPSDKIVLRKYLSRLQSETQS